MSKHALAIAVLSILIAGCAGQPSTAAPTPIIQTVLVTQIIPASTLTPYPTHTPIPTYTPYPTYTAAPPIVITATPIPPTPTPLLTSTPTRPPTATPLPTKTPNLTMTAIIAELAEKRAPREDGFYLVGVDISPGTWRSQGTGSNCYWARTTRTGDILGNHYGMSGGTIYIAPGDFQVQFRGCGTWVFLQ